MKRRTFLDRSGKAIALAAGLALMSGSAALAQDGLIKVITPYSVGGSVDLLARALTEQLHAVDDQHSYVVEPHPGASGAIANDVVASADPDGGTLLLQTTSAFTMLPHTYEDPDKQGRSELIPIAVLTKLEFALYVNAEMPAETVAEYTELVRGDEDYRFYGVSGIGNLTHFYGVMLSNAIDVPLEAVAFKGGSPTLLGTMGGHVPASVGSINGSLIGARDEGKIRILATMGPERSPVLPDVPSMTEAGVPEIAIGEWIGIFAPAGTPDDVVEELRATIEEAKASPEFQAALEGIGLIPMDATRDEMIADLDEGYDVWKPIVEASGFKR